VLMNSYCRKNVVFIFLYGPRPKLHLWWYAIPRQRIGFGQLTWDKEINNHDLLWDCPPLPILRWQHYRNSKEDINWFRVSCTRRNHLNRKHKVLLGTIRLQHNHGAIFTPRLAYKWKINDNNIVRFNTGFEL
jgi:outer membrane receptor for ferrienterochelin and colicins